MGSVLTGATLIDGNGGEPLAEAAVCVEGERIAWVGRAADLPADARGYEQIDVSGKCAAAGLNRRPHSHLLQRRRKHLRLA